jgi:hypothetical protein
LFSKDTPPHEVCEYQGCFFQPQPAVESEEIFVTVRFMRFGIPIFDELFSTDGN